MNLKFQYYIFPPFFVHISFRVNRIHISQVFYAADTKRRTRKRIFKLIISEQKQNKKPVPIMQAEQTSFRYCTSSHPGCHCRQTCAVPTRTHVSFINNNKWMHNSENKKITGYKHTQADTRGNCTHWLLPLRTKMQRLLFSSIMSNECVNNKNMQQLHHYNNNRIHCNSE